MLVLAVTSLGAILLALPLREKNSLGEQPAAQVRGGMTRRQQLRLSFKNPSNLCPHAGFFTCGFHIAFLVTHLPTEIGLCSLPAALVNLPIREAHPKLAAAAA